MVSQVRCIHLSQDCMITSGFLRSIAFSLSLFHSWSSLLKLWHLPIPSTEEKRFRFNFGNWRTFQEVSWPSRLLGPLLNKAMRRRILTLLGLLTGFKWLSLAQKKTPRNEFSPIFLWTRTLWRLRESWSRALKASWQASVTNIHKYHPWYFFTPIDCPHSTFQK